MTLSSLRERVNQLAVFGILGYTVGMQEINSFLDSELVRRTHQWQQLKKVLGKALPAEFLKKVSYANLENGTLTIFSDAPEWTSRMRFYNTEIIEVFAQENLKVVDVQVRTVPQPEARPPAE